LCYILDKGSKGAYMKKKLLIMLYVAAMLILVPSFAYGDVGPKPSVIVNFDGLEGKTYHVTLLSEESSTGPYSSNKS
jgi:hypothetical protein